MIHLKKYRHFFMVKYSRCSVESHAACVYLKILTDVKNITDAEFLCRADVRNAELHRL